MYYMCMNYILCRTPVVHMFHTCNAGVYPTQYHILHVKNYMCNTCVYPTHVLYV